MVPLMESEGSLYYIAPSKYETYTDKGSWVLGEGVLSGIRGGTRYSAEPSSLTIGIKRVTRSTVSLGGAPYRPNGTSADSFEENSIGLNFTLTLENQFPFGEYESLEFHSGGYIYQFTNAVISEDGIRFLSSELVMMTASVNNTYTVRKNHE